jgi:hypothetical protein
MKKSLLCTLLMACACFAWSQKYNINWGDQLKMKKGTTDLDITGADNTGYYFIEKRLKAGFGMAFGGSNISYKLIKFDNSFEEEWDEDYNKELKGLEFLSIQPLDKDLYLFATDYVKKEKQYKVFGTKIDKSSGKLADEFKELASYERESRKDDFQAKLTKQLNGKNFLLVSDLTGKTHTSLAVTLLDPKLKQLSTTNINLEFEPGYYALQDVKYVNDRIVVLGKSFEEVVIKRKRKKKVFKSFVLAIYDLKGGKIKDIPLDVQDKFTLEGKLLELENNEVALSGFYSKDGKKRNLNGFFINKIDVAKGELTLSSTKEITSGMLGQNYSDDNDDNDDADETEKTDTKKSGDEEEEDEEFDNEFTIKSVDVNPLDGTFMIAAEISQVKLRVSTSYSPGAGGMGRSRTTYTYYFKNQDILLICADKTGKIKWLNVIPKNQNERVSTSSGSPGFGLSFSVNAASYFAYGGGMPYHSSFKSTFVKDKYIILYNDNKKNEDVAAYGDKVKSISNFKKRGEMFGLSFDLASGKTTKTPISACSDDDVITMPRHSFVMGNSLIVPAWRQKGIGKTIFKIAKVTIQ